MKLLTSGLAALKLAHAFWHVFIGFMTILLRFPRLSEAQKRQRIQVWSLKMLGIFSLKLIVRGSPTPNGPLLLVANHISWLDITSLHAATYCRFVSKNDILQWPFIGKLASGIGTLFIERSSRRDAMRVVHQMAAALSAGDVLGVFPEGTTSDGTTLLPFHANLFEAAVTSQAPVQPVAIAFIMEATGQPSFAPCYINDDTLMQSVWRTLRTPGIAVVVSFGELQSAHGRGRRQWAQDVRAEVERLRT